MLGVRGRPRREVGIQGVAAVDAAERHGSVEMMMLMVMPMLADGVCSAVVIGSNVDTPHPSTRWNTN